MENIRVNVPSVFTVAVGTQPDVMTNAAIRLLGSDDAMIFASRPRKSSSASCGK